MGAFFSKQVDRRKLVTTEKQALSTRLSSSGDTFPGSDHRPSDRKRWMSELGADRVRVHQVVWPGTHDSATNKIGVPLVTRPFAQCQSMYAVDVVLDDVRRFLAETDSEVLILEVRTEFGHEDPPEFAKFLVDKLGEENLIHQDEAVFHKTIAELLPRRVICVWKPRKSPAPKPGEPLCPVLCVWPVTKRIHGYARLFIAEAFAKGLGDKLQVFSTDFIDGDFVDACAGVTKARVEGTA
ncbi:hypothetical protein HU200_010465 [Digitaria exilis]|uniref:Uncharacterized protein n=1 Tax=Digitaria exilis TaxID=1010633 RepID=A0A835FIM5_9POAL|nr:hypothetical protein HU200_010465 [Digitaria exilis]